MKNYSKTIRLLIFALLFALIATLLYFVILMEITKGNEFILELRSNLKLEVIKEQRFLSVKNLVRNIKDERKELDGYFVSDESIVAFLGAVEGLGIKTGAIVEINTVDVEEIDEEDSISELLRVSIDVRGNWSSVFHVLSLLEAMPLPISVKDVQLSVREGEEEQIWNGSYEVVVDKLK